MKKFPKSRIQRILVPLFEFVWWNRLWDEYPRHSGHLHRDYVYKVKGWRSAIIDRFGRGRQTVVFLFRDNQ